MNKLCLSGVSRIINGNTILDDINLTIGGGVTVICGTSGAGKSTLLNIIGALDKPDKGTITCNGKTLNLSDDNVADGFRAEMVSFVFQDGNLLSGITVRENLEIITRLNGVSKECDELAERFRISSILDHKSETVSGGERQRASIVRALLKNADFILADEPTGSLDEENSITVFEALSECARKYGRSVVIVTHDTELASRYADRIITLSDGRIVNDVISSDIHETATKKASDTNGFALSFRDKCLIARKAFSSEKKRMNTLIFITALTLATLGLCYAFWGSGSRIADSVNNNYLETDLVEAVKRSDNVTRYLINIPFNEDDMNYISQEGICSEVVGYYPITLTVTGSSKVCELPNLRFIKLDDFFNDRIMSNDIEGSFPKKENEMILGSYEALTLFGTDDCIGRTVSLNSGSKEAYEAIVCGVNKTVNLDGNTYSYISSDVSYNFVETFDSKNAIIEIKSKVDENTSNVSSMGIPAGVEVYSNQDILFGSFPANKNEIAVDLILVNALLSKKPSEHITADNLKDNMKEISELMDTELYFYSNDVYTVRICGICNENGKVLISEGLGIDVSRALPSKLEMYLKDKSTIENFENMVINTKYSCLMKYKHIAASVGSKTSSLVVVLLVLTLIMLVITAIVINSLVSLSVESNKYQTGVLRALGGSRRNIGEIYTIRYAGASIIAAVAAALLFMLISYIGNVILAKEMIKLKFSPIAFALMAVGCILMILIAALISVRRTYKLNITDCLKSR